MNIKHMTKEEFLKLLKKDEIHIRMDSIVIDDPIAKRKKTFDISKNRVSMQSSFTVQAHQGAWLAQDYIDKAFKDAHDKYIGIDEAALINDGCAWALISLDENGVFHVDPVPKDEVIVLDSMQAMPKKEVKKPFYRELEKKSRSRK